MFVIGKHDCRKDISSRNNLYESLRADLLGAELQGQPLELAAKTRTKSVPALPNALVSLSL